MFKDICINEYGYDCRFDYNKALSVIEYHILNNDFVSIKEIAQDLKITEKTIIKHRKLLSGRIIKDKQQCIKRTFAMNSETKVREDITDLYDDTIVVAFRNCKLSIFNRFNNDKDEVAIFKNKKNHSFELIHRDEDTFELVKESMEQNGNKFIASYPVWFNAFSKNRYLNCHLTQKIFQLILIENGYDYVFFLRLYEITEDLKHDEELLDVINKAINYMKKID